MPDSVCRSPHRHIMYQTFYQLESDPFRLAPDPRFSYRHRSYGAACRQLHEALAQAEGFVMLAARPGTGKTTLTEDFVASLEPGRYQVARLAITQMDATELLRLIGFAFEVEVTDLDRAGILHRLEERLLAIQDQGRQALLVVDEAQGLGIEALEQLRLLSNLHHRERALLQIFLVGQEQLQAVLALPEMEQLQQRVLAACRLEPLTLTEACAYAHHRLCIGGWRGDPTIDPGVFILLHRFSQGLPRYLNRLCNRLLLHGAVEQKHYLGMDDATTILLDLSEELLTPVHDQPGPSGVSNRELLHAVAGGEDWQSMLSQPEQLFLQQARFEPPPALTETVPAPITADPAAAPPPGRTHARPARTWLRWVTGAAAVLVLTLALVEQHDGLVRAVASTDWLNLPAPAAGPAGETGGDAAPAGPASAAPDPEPVATPEAAAASASRADAANASPQTALERAPEDGPEAQSASRSLAPPATIELARATPTLRSAPAASPEPATADPAPAGEPVREPAAAGPADAPVTALLQQAEAAFEADHLTVPEGSSAYDFLRKAERLNPDHPRVAAGLDRIAQRYGVLARWWMDQGEYGKAMRLIERGLNVRPQHPTLHGLRQEMHALALHGEQPSPFPSAFEESPPAESQTPGTSDQAPNRFFDRLKTLLRGDRRPER